jgi:adhesin transport system outer membrane protein
MPKNLLRDSLLAAGIFAVGIGSTFTPSFSMSMREAVGIAVDSNPEIGEAISNREAIEFELRQGRGLWMPRVDLEASIGGEIRNNRTTRAAERPGALNSKYDTDHLFLRRQASVVVRQLLFDGFGVDAEIERQASRVDGASFRVLERSEFVALAVIREYLDILRLRKVLGYTRQNISYHQGVLQKIGQGTSGGSISVADRQQAEERLYSARARLEEAKEEFQAAHTRFIKLVGRDSGKMSRPKSVARAIPKTLSSAIGQARVNHPSVKLASADIDAAAALVKAAESKYYPRVLLEGRGRLGRDLDGTKGQDNDAQANVIVEWNLFNGGIDKANREEQVRRVDESRMTLHRVSREVEEGVRLSWDRKTLQRRRLAALRQQAAKTEQLITSYTEQFKIGQRSLLDVLDTQNSRLFSNIAVVTAATAVKFAEYRLLASTGTLLKVMSIKPPSAAWAYAREDAKVPPTPAAETMTRNSPIRPVMPTAGSLY